MAFYGRRRYKRKKRSNPSLISQVTRPLRMPFSAIGIKSPILQTILMMPIGLGLLQRFNEDWYDWFMEQPEVFNDWLDDKFMGGGAV